MIDYTHRSYKKEILDRDNIPVEDIVENMHELDFINTWLGGHSITLQGFKNLIDNFGGYWSFWFVDLFILLIPNFIVNLKTFLANSKSVIFFHWTFKEMYYFIIKDINEFYSTRKIILKIMNLFLTMTNQRVKFQFCTK